MTPPVNIAGLFKRPAAVFRELFGETAQRQMAVATTSPESLAAESRVLYGGQAIRGFAQAFRRELGHLPRVQSTIEEIEQIARVPYGSARAISLSRYMKEGWIPSEHSGTAAELFGRFTRPTGVGIVTRLPFEAFFQGGSKRIQAARSRLAIAHEALESRMPLSHWDMMQSMREHNVAAHASPFVKTREARFAMMAGPREMSTFLRTLQFEMGNLEKMDIKASMGKVLPEDIRHGQRYAQLVVKLRGIVEKELRTSLRDRREMRKLKGVRPSVGGHAPWMPKADTMKPHAEAGFPAGYQDPGVLDVIMDLETTGLGPDKKVVQVSLRSNGRKLYSAYYSAIDKQALMDAGVDQRFIRSGKPLPQSVIKMAIQAGYEPGVEAEGGVLNKVLRSELRQSLRGRALPDQKSLALGMLEALEKAAGNRKIRMGGWNISSFDLPALRDLFDKTGLTDRASTLFNPRRMSVNSIESTFTRAVFDRMKTDPNFVPAVSNNAVLRAAAGQGQVAFQTYDEAVKRGAVTELKGLRTFMDDVRTGRPAFRKRVDDWVANKTRSVVGTPLESVYRQAGDKALKVLESVHSAKDYERVTRWAHRSSLKGLVEGGPSFVGVVDEMYADANAPWFRVFGNVSEFNPAFGGINASTTGSLLRTGGGQLGQVGHAVLQAADHLKASGFDIGDKRLVRLGRRLRNTHDANADTEITELVESLTRDHPRLKQALEEIHVSPAAAQSRLLSRMNATLQGSVATETASNAARRASSMSAREVSKAAADAAGKTRGLNWAKIGLIAGGFALLGERNRKPEIQGVREAAGDYDVISAINPSEMGGNVSDFGSGYHRELGLWRAGEMAYAPYTTAGWERREKELTQVGGQALDLVLEMNSLRDMTESYRRPPSVLPPIGNVSPRAIAIAQEMLTEDQVKIRRGRTGEKTYLATAFPDPRKVRVWTSGNLQNQAYALLQESRVVTTALEALNTFGIDINLGPAQSAQYQMEPPAEVPEAAVPRGGFGGYPQYLFSQAKMSGVRNPNGQMRTLPFPRMRYQSTSKFSERYG